MTKQDYDDVREQIDIQSNICTYLKNIKEVMDAYPQLKGETLQDVFWWLLDRQIYWENKIKESCNVDGARPTEVDSVNEIIQDNGGDCQMNINDIILKEDYDRSQCVYGPDSPMSCILCSQLCPERADDLKKAGIKVECIPTEKNSSNG